MKKIALFVFAFVVTSLVGQAQVKFSENFDSCPALTLQEEYKTTPAEPSGVYPEGWNVEITHENNVFTYSDGYQFKAPTIIENEGRKFLALRANVLAGDSAYCVMNTPVKCGPGEQCVVTVVGKKLASSGELRMGLFLLPYGISSYYDHKFTSTTEWDTVTFRFVFKGSINTYVIGVEGNNGVLIDEYTLREPEVYWPVNVFISEIVTTSAKVKWDPAKNAQVYDLFVGPKGCVPGDMTQDSIFYYSSISNTEYVVSDIYPGTSYDVYVRGINNDQGITGEWSDIKTFTTPHLCQYIETFDGFITSISPEERIIPENWSYYNGYQGTSIHNMAISPCVVNNGSGSKPNTLEFCFNASSQSTNDNYYKYLTDQYAILPELPIQGSQISFSARHSNNEAPLIFGLVEYNDDIETFEEIDIMYPTLSHTVYTYDMSAYEGKARHFAFKALNPEQSLNYRLKIDDIYVDYENSDARDIEEVDVHAQWAKIAWANTSVKYEYALLTEDRTPNVDEIVVSPFSYVTLEDLTPEQTYYIYVRAMLCDESMGEWTSHSFTTPSGVGVEENEINKISVYPNPVKDFFTLKGVDNGKMIQLFDISGREVMNFIYDGRSINMSNLSNGVYTLKVEDHTLKIVK